MAAHRMTPARKAALRKAQLASARKRKGRGKNTSKSSIARRKNTKRALKYAGVAAATIGTGAVVYRNRENWIIKHVAVTKAVRSHMKKAKETGMKLSKVDIQWIKEQERQDHANRSVFRVREYKEARRVARLATSRGKSLRPDRKNNAYSAGMQVTGVPNAKQRYYFEAYRKDVHSRALSRLAKMKGKKRGFSYNSGKRLLVNQKGQVRRALF